MSRTISVADDVYEWMKEEKGERSFSELIRGLRDKNCDFSEVNGQKILGETDLEEVERTVDEASDEAMNEVGDRN